MIVGRVDLTRASQTVTGLAATAIQPRIEDVDEADFQDFLFDSKKSVVMNTVSQGEDCNKAGLLTSIRKSLSKRWPHQSCIQLETR
jgi:hypothetical protein